MIFAPAKKRQVNMNLRYIRQGECNRCGQCCINEDCEYFEMGEPATCKIHDKECPPKCEWFPQAPPIIFEKCSYYFLDTWEDNRVVGVKEV